MKQETVFLLQNELTILMLSSLLEFLRDLIRMFVNPSNIQALHFSNKY